MPGPHPSTKPQSGPLRKTQALSRRNNGTPRLLIEVDSRGLDVVEVYNNTPQGELT